MSSCAIRQLCVQKKTAAIFFQNENCNLKKRSKKFENYEAILKYIFLMLKIALLKNIISCGLLISEKAVHSF